MTGIFALSPRHLLAPLLAIGAMATSTVAFGQTPERPERGAAMTQDQASQMADRAFARLDANSDGRIDAADNAARQRAMFDRLDADGNGTISYAEFQSARADRHGAGDKQRGAMRGDRAERGEHDARGRRGAIRGGAMGAMARTADADKDGAITKDEFRAAAMARFAAADTDHDGQVTRAERRDRRGRHRQSGQEGHHGDMPARPVG